MEKAFNPCCGYVTNSADLLPEFESATPDVGDLSICLNCGALLAYRDGERNLTRLATRRQMEGLNSEQRRYIKIVQRYIRARGLIHKPGLS
jgi:hypothetical protein